jgi:hypothetical protein
MDRLRATGFLETMMNRMACREIDPHSAVEETVTALGWSDPAPHTRGREGEERGGA